MIQIRNSHNLKNFVNNHVEAGTTIVTDGSIGYSFPSNDNSV